MFARFHSTAALTYDHPCIPIERGSCSGSSRGVPLPDATGLQVAAYSLAPHTTQNSRKGGPPASFPSRDTPYHGTAYGIITRGITRETPHQPASSTGQQGGRRKAACLGRRVTVAAGAPQSTKRPERVQPIRHPFFCQNSTLKPVHALLPAFTSAPLAVPHRGLCLPCFPSPRYCIFTFHFAWATAGNATERSRGRRRPIGKQSYRHPTHGRPLKQRSPWTNRAIRCSGGFVSTTSVEKSTATLSSDTR